MRLLNQLNEAEGSAVRHDLKAVSSLIQQSHDSQLTTRTAPLYIQVAQYKKQMIGVIVGYQGFDVLSMQSGMHLADIVVDVAHRKQGVGRALIKALAQTNQEQGGAWMSLTSLKRNKVGDKFYRALGFQAVDVQFFALGENGMKLL